MRYVILLLSFAVCAAAASPAAEFQRAQALSSEQRHEAALALFEQALLSDPNNLQYGSEYRQAVIRAGAYDRCLKFFEQLVAAHPGAANAHLNYGFAYVDKIPAAGSITQVILANSALNRFTKAVELQPSWITYYTRGNSYLFWPRIFNRTTLGIADLEQAISVQKRSQKRSFQVRAWVSLGDGYWKIDQLEKARAVWREGLELFPGNEQLRLRLEKTGDALKALIEQAMDPNRRVNTDLSETWLQP
jgi:tetratricopeptide (TPR) repeat protein